MLPLKLGRPILKVLPCTVYCIRVADDTGSKVSMTYSIQTGQNLIAGGSCALTTRVVTGIEPLCPLRMQSQVMYVDPAPISDYTI